MARTEAELAAAAGDEEEAALLVSAGGRGAGPSARRDVHLLSSSFLFVFLAYHAAQNLQSTVNTDENLGSLSLGLLYTSFTAFAGVGSAVVRRMGSRRALVVGTSGYLLYIAANLAPSWYARARLVSLFSSAAALTAAHFELGIWGILASHRSNGALTGRCGS